MQPCDSLLHAKVLLDQGPLWQPKYDYAIAINSGLVCDIGPSSDLAGRWQPKKTLNLSNHLVLPGLINSHTHAAMTFLRGYADDLPLLEWLTQKIFPKEAALTRELVASASLLGFAEMLATGTTACLDMYIFVDAVLDAAHTSGIRCITGEGIFATPSAAISRYEEGLERTEDLALRYQDNPRLGVMVSPHSVYTTNRVILEACVACAEKLHLPIHMHLAESRAETEQSLAMHGLRPFAVCEATGLLTQPCTFAHVVDLNCEEQTQLAKAKDACVVHNPSSNMKLASGIAPVGDFLQQKIPVALGTDGAASNNMLNMFAEMRTAALLHKVATLDPTSLNARQCLSLATAGGAKALHQPQLGHLAVGAFADLTALDLSAPNLTPLHTPVSQIVYAATGHEVVLTMVAGEVLYDHGHFTRFDYGALRSTMEEIVRTMFR